jgi:hypothetical protein
MVPEPAERCTLKAMRELPTLATTLRLAAKETLVGDTMVMVTRPWALEPEAKTRTGVTVEPESAAITVKQMNLFMNLPYL